MTRIFETVTVPVTCVDDKGEQAYLRGSIVVEVPRMSLGEAPVVVRHEGVRPARRVGLSKPRAANTEEYRAFGGELLVKCRYNGRVIQPEDLTERKAIQAGDRDTFRFSDHPLNRHHRKMADLPPLPRAKEGRHLTMSTQPVAEDRENWRASAERVRGHASKCAFIDGELWVRSDGPMVQGVSYTTPGAGWQDLEGAPVPLERKVKLVPTEHDRVFSLRERQGMELFSAFGQDDVAKIYAEKWPNGFVSELNPVTILSNEGWDVGLVKQRRAQRALRTAGTILCSYLEDRSMDRIKGPLLDAYVRTRVAVEDEGAEFSEVFGAVRELRERMPHTTVREKLTGQQQTDRLFEIMDVMGATYEELSGLKL